MILAFSYQAAHTAGCLQNFDDRITAAATSRRNQLLSHDRQQRQRQLLPYLGLIALRKGVENSGHGLRGVVGVKCRKHQMAGFRGCKNGCDGLGIAHFPHQNHIRILAQDAAQTNRRSPAHPGPPRSAR